MNGKQQKGSKLRAFYEIISESGIWNQQEHFGASRKSIADRLASSGMITPLINGGQPNGHYHPRSILFTLEDSPYTANLDSLVEFGRGAYPLFLSTLRFTRDYAQFEGGASENQIPTNVDAWLVNFALGRPYDALLALERAGTNSGVYGLFSQQFPDFPSSGDAEMLGKWVELKSLRLSNGDIKLGRGKQEHIYVPFMNPQDDISLLQQMQARGLDEITAGQHRLTRGDLFKGIIVKSGYGAGIEFMLPFVGETKPGSMREEHTDPLGNARQVFNSFFGYKPSNGA